MNFLAAGWKILFFVGAAAMLVGGLLLLDPSSHIQTSGLSASQIYGISPSLAGWALHASREATFTLVLIGFVTSAISWKAYSKGEKWSWFALAFLTVGYSVGNILIHLAFGDTTYFPVVIPLLILSITGLLLPYRRIFKQPTKQNS